MTNFKLVIVAMVVVVVAVIGLSPLAQAQEKADCVKTTKPCFKDGKLKEEQGLECCNPLKDAVENSLVCVCSLFGDTQFLKIMGTDPKTALALPGHCGIDFDLVSGCKAALAPPAPSPASTQTPSDQPAASPSAPTTTVTTTPGPSDGKNAASSNMALSAVTMLSSFLIWATMML